MSGTRAPRLPAGLLGRVLGILLLAVLFEFAGSTLLYERASRELVRDDEAHRLAEHLEVAGRLLDQRGASARPALAEQLSTERYEVRWGGLAPAAAPDAASRLMAARVAEWEPVLARRDLRLRVAVFAGRPVLVGGFRLADGSWVRVRAAAPGDADRGWHRILLALLPAAIVLGMGAWLFGRTLRPIAALADATERVGRGGGAGMAEAGPGELRRLIRSFNAMQARIGQLIADRTQALAAVGHDLRTPLARLRLRIDGVADPHAQRAAEDDLDEMEAMIGSLLAYLGGENDPEPPERVDVAVLAQTVVDDATDRGADACYDGPDHLEASVRRGGLKRALVNLVDNAIHYGDSVRLTLGGDATRMVFAVEDDGPGIPADRLDAVLRPFTRLDPARSRNTRGLGLGLAIVRRVAEAEGGTLTLRNRAGGGLRAELTLPRR